MKNSIFILLFTLSIGTFGQGRVDGFYKGKGNLDIAIGAANEFGPKYYAGTNLTDGLSRNVFGLNAFFAYGITNNFDVNISVPFINVNGSVSGIQDPSIYLKYQLFSFGKLNYSTGIEQDGSGVKTKPRVYVSLAGGFSSNITNYQVEGLNAIGQQAKVFDIRPFVHINLTNSTFLTLQGAYNYKFDPVPHAIAFAAKLGIAKGNWYADFWYDGQIGIGGLDYLGTPVPTTFRELGVSYHKIGGTFYKPFNEKLGWYGGLSYVLAGRNISKGIGVNIGLVFKPDLKK